jgi:uncharacterized protein
MKLVLSLACGLVFGLGLIASGMTDPAKVQGFLDPFGRWDPSLAFVMGGAVAVAAVGYALARRRNRAWSGEALSIPQDRHIDKRLIGGGLLFGAGWGIAGFCPGPAVAALGAGFGPAVWFVGAMLAGMWLHDRFLAARILVADR